MTEQLITPDVVIAQGEEQVSTLVDGETVLMNVGNGRYYKLDDIGSRIWNLIEKPTSVSAVCDQLLEEFEVERATCEGDIMVMLNRLLENNLIQVVQK
jgi:hypothetical protein